MIARWKQAEIETPTARGLVHRQAVRRALTRMLARRDSPPPSTPPLATGSAWLFVAWSWFVAGAWLLTWWMQWP